MATHSKSKKSGRQSSGDADGDFVAARLPIMNTAASKRKQRHSSVKQTLVEDTTSESESDKPTPKRAKTKKDESDDALDNNGMIRIIPRDEVKVRQIQMTIILRPPPVDHKRLNQQIQEMPEEIQEQFRVQCVLSVEDNTNFVRAFLYSKDVMAHGTLIRKAIEDREVVLGGKNFLRQFNRLHPDVIRNAKNLMIVYITEDITMANGEWKKRQDAHDELMAKYNKFQRLRGIGFMLDEFCLEEPPAPIRARHKMYPMSEPRWGSGECQVMMACRKFVNVEHLTIDLTSHVNYDGIDKGKFSTDTWYGDRVGEHIYAAVGFKAFSTRNNNEFDTPAQARGENKLKKLTLVLGSGEVSKVEVSEPNFAASINMGFRGPKDAPNWQWLRYYFRRPKTAVAVHGNVIHGQAYEPFVHTPFTVFKKDEQAGLVSYEREPPKEVEAEEEAEEE